MLSTSSFVFAAILFLAKGINCCVVTPKELLTTVGEVVSLGCNARPNNEQQGTVSNLKLENEDKTETLIFEAPVYGARGKIADPFVAVGYFLSELDEQLVNATIQINKTQLKHGGRYVCSCTRATSSTGSGNLVVLADKLSFGLNGENPHTPGEALLDLNCSLSFSGSISFVSVDLTIQDANGMELTAKRNLSLSWRSQGGSHHVNYSFIAHRNSKEQIFACEMKVWNHSSLDRRLLRSMTYGLNVYRGTEADFGSSAFGFRNGLISACCVIVILLAVIVLMYKRLHRFSVIANQKSIAQPNYESMDKEQRMAGSNEPYEELNLNDPSIQTGQYIEVVP